MPRVPVPPTASGSPHPPGSPAPGIAIGPAATMSPFANWLPWFVCALLFLATTVNYMDRTVLSLIEPVLHDLPFMGWNHAAPATAQPLFNNNFGNILIAFQISYGLGFLFAGRLIDRLGTKTGYALAILVWSLSAMAHAWVGSVAGFALARFFLGLGESGNFPAAIKAITEWYPAEQRALATGLFNSGTNAASLIAPWLIPLITLRFGWQAAFLSTGAFGLLWLALWLPFPYNRLRRGSTQSQAELALPLAPALTGGRGLFSTVLRERGTWAFSLAKFLTDPVWWFYLFWLPKYFHETYGLTLTHLGPPIIVIYFCSSFGSVFGGWLAGARMRQTAGPSAASPSTISPSAIDLSAAGPSTVHPTANRRLSVASAGPQTLTTVQRGRRSALLTCAFGALPVMLVPLMSRLAPGNVWPAVALLALAAAAHQGWSANLYNAPGDTLPAATVSTVVGIGSAAGALGGALFTWLTKTLWNSHPFAIFFLGSVAYLTAYLLFRRLAPRAAAPARV